MEMNLIIGNAISLVAALFTIASSLARGRRRIYSLQAIQCLVMAIASVFFLSASGVTTFLLCTIRNYLVSRDRFDKKMCGIFLVLTVLLGLVSNNRGLLGLLPIITTVIYTIGSYTFTENIKIKCNITLNQLLWAIYDFLILDIVSGVVDSLSVVVTVFAIGRDLREGKNEHSDIRNKEVL